MAKPKHAPKPGPAPKLADVLDPGRTTTALFSDCILATGQKGRPVQPQGGGEKEALNPAEVERLMARGGHQRVWAVQQITPGGAWRELALANNCGAPAAIGRAVSGVMSYSICTSEHLMGVQCHTLQNSNVIHFRTVDFFPKKEKLI